MAGPYTSPPTRPSDGWCCAATPTTAAAGRRDSARSRSIWTSPPPAPWQRSRPAARTTSRRPAGPRRPPSTALRPRARRAHRQPAVLQLGPSPSSTTSRQHTPAALRPHPMGKAVNQALDRRALAHGDPAATPARPDVRPTSSSHPTPGLPRRGDLPAGGPDLERARRLAGDQRPRAVLYTCDQPACVEQAAPRAGTSPPSRSTSRSSSSDSWSGPRRMKRPGNRGTRLQQLVPRLRGCLGRRRPVPLAGAVCPTRAGSATAGSNGRIRAALACATTRLASARSRGSTPTSPGPGPPRRSRGRVQGFLLRPHRLQIHRPISGMSLGALCVRG